MAEQPPPRRQTTHFISRKFAAAGLGFSEVIKNKTPSPCSLTEFMDYLVYVERNAENLQFFLWYCGYVQRWSQLPPHQKLLSPEWNPDGDLAIKLPAVVAAHKRAKSEKLTNILAILERESAVSEPMPLPGPKHAPVPRDAAPGADSLDWQLPPLRDLESPVNSTASTPDKPTEQQIQQQPFRDEMTRIASHYVADSSPRQLKLSLQDRDACLKALPHTTHPSALLPAFTMVGAILRDFSHPSFVAWSVSNANSPRLVLVRIAATAVILAGIVLDLVLVLSHRSPYLRVFCILLFWSGATVLVAALRGLCVMLHLRGLRQLRPWELPDADEIDFEERGHGSDATHAGADGGSKTPPSRHKFHPSWYGHYSPAGKSSPSDSGADTRSRSNSSSSNCVDPLRKPTMHPLGPDNDFAEEQWFKAYSRRPLLRRAFAPSVAVCNRDIKLLQDRVALHAVIIGGGISAVLTIISLFLPSRNLF